MKVLVVGGSGFLGGAVARAAVDRGHDVTVLSRGKMAKQVESAAHIAAERHGSLTELDGLRFDLVADTCAFGPESVRHLLNRLEGRVGCYAFVSSINAYPDLSQPQMKEDGPTASAAADVLEQLRNLAPEEKGNSANYDAHYGALKVAAENVALEMLPERAMILRSGLLVGAGDPLDRFAYWVRRVDQGGDIAVPGKPERLIQLIDVRDFADFILLGKAGVFNLTSRAFTFETMLNTLKVVSGSDARFRWVPDDVVQSQGVKWWTELPLWVPEGEALFRHALNVDVSKALAAGLVPRPLAETAEWVLAWDRTRRVETLKTGISEDREKALLAAAP